MLDLDSATLAADHERLRRKAVHETDLAQLRFALMHGNGNVILVVDTGLSGLSTKDVTSELARTVCQSFHATRVDGIAFLATSADRVRMTYFEGDGLHSQMCGNALRCATRYCAEQGYICAVQDFIATDDGLKWVCAEGGRIRVALGQGREFQQVAEDRWFVFSGLPHLVVVVDDLASVDVKTEGAKLRYDRELCLRLNHPEGLHVDFLRRDGAGIAIRTYEPGTEDETLACGTGVGGSAYVAHRVWGLSYPIPVLTRGGRMTVEEHEHGLLIGGSTGYLYSNIDLPSPA